MSPRIAFWTSAFEVGMEAVASEVDCLRKAFPRSIMWGVSPHRFLRISYKNGYSFHPRLHLAFRAVAWLCQDAFDLHHLYGGLNDWFHLKAVRKHPAVLTNALGGRVTDARLLDKIDQFVVQWPAARGELQDLGINPHRIQLIFPPIDTQCYRPTMPPDSGFTVLFASSPDRSDWLQPRGVDLLLDAAELRPDMQFVLVWRPWGNSLEVVRDWVKERGLQNVEIRVAKFSNMCTHYERAHVTIAPFTSREHCKPMPNSLIESMSCGRPVLATNVVELSEIIAERSAGVVTSPSGAAIAEALDAVRANWKIYSASARQTAEELFTKKQFLNRYQRLYEGLTCNKTRRS